MRYSTICKYRDDELYYLLMLRNGMPKCCDILSFYNASNGDWKQFSYMRVILCLKQQSMYLYGREIFWYFIHANILKSYDFMCNYNIESKQVLEKQRLASNKVYYYLPANIKKIRSCVCEFWAHGVHFLDNVAVS